MRAISIVVPTLNEYQNVPVLMSRIAATFDGSGIEFEVVFVDDHSTDGTIEVIKEVAKLYPARLHMKSGKRGKAHSLLEGFKLAQYGVICMIDADLQYPPESIVSMYRLLESMNCDVVLTERKDEEGTSKLRQLSSKVFNLVFTRLLFGIQYDSQSGLKLFRKEVIENISLDPTPWSFDLEFIVRSLEHNYKIQNYEIPFSKRFSGEAKVHILKVTYELARASINLRLHSSPRKIKRAYTMNLKYVKQTFTVLSLFVLSLVAALSVPTATHALTHIADGQVHTVSLPLPISLLTQPEVSLPTESVSSAPSSTTSGVMMSPTDSSIDSLSAATPTNVPTASAPVTTTQQPAQTWLAAAHFDTASQSQVPSGLSLASTNATYPKLSRVSSFSYVKPRPYLSVVPWLVSLGAILLLGATYAIYVMRRNIHNRTGIIA